MSSEAIERAQSGDTMTPEPLTPDKLDAIAARADAATEGPWSASVIDGTGDVYGPDGMGVAYDCEGGCASEEDAEFIAHARSDVPALVEEVRRLRAALVELSGATDHLLDVGLDDRYYGHAANMAHEAWMAVRDLLAAGGSE